MGLHRWGGEGREGLARVQGEALQGGLGELVLPEGTPQGSSRRKLWKSKDGAGKPLAVAST